MLSVGRPKPAIKPEPQAQSLPDFDYTMTEAKWRDSGNHLSWMRHQLASDYGKQFMGVLLNASPIGSNIDGNSSYELGRVSGFNDAIELITRLTVPLPRHEELEADYGAEQILKDLNYPPKK